MTLDWNELNEQTIITLNEGFDLIKVVYLPVHKALDSFTQLL
jgi:hypothetical protein